MDSGVLAADASPPDSSTPDATRSDGATPPSEALTVELLIGTDASLTEQHGDGLGCYVEGVAAHVNYIFSNLAPDLDLRIVLVRHEADVDTRGLELGSNRDALLSRWVEWSNAENVDGDDDPNHFDYKVLLTGQSFGRSGWATSGPAICNPNAGAIVRDKGYYGAKIVAHELAHTLGLGHVEGSQYLMNANPGTAWSDASVASLLALDLSSEACLADGVEPPSSPGIPTFTHEEQCQTRYGAPACSMSAAQRDCERLVCQTGAGSCSWEVGPRLDGSACGDGRWCIGGTCVDRPSGGSAGFTCSP